MNDVVRLRGTVHVEHSLARRGAERLWRSLHEEAFVTALGGGTIRDMVLGHYPIGWTQHPEYVYLVISAGLLTIVQSSCRLSFVLRP